MMLILSIVTHNIHDTARNQSGRVSILQNQVKDLQRDKSKYMELYKDAVGRAEKEAQVSPKFVASIQQF